MQEQDHITDLKREKAESDALFLSIGEGAIVTDEKGRIARINKAALDILGYEHDELIGLWYPEAVVAEDEEGRVIPNLSRPITNVFLTGASIATRLYYRKKDGSRVIVFLTVSPVMLEGRPIGAIEVFRDITHEVELEKAKDEFISLASHQLRTPATGVKQYIGMMLQGYVGEFTPKQMLMVQNAYECNERQMTIINDLLKVAQIDAGKVTLHPDDTDIADMVGRIIEEQTPKFTAREQRVSYHPPEGSFVAYIDPTLIRMVIENIIDNASKYTPPGKSIAVSVRLKEDTVLVVVKDEGVGIDPKDLEQVFQKFSRLPNPLSDVVGGTGLGLYWAKRIMDLHGGAIKVRSIIDKGTTFIIRIPLQI